MNDNNEMMGSNWLLILLFFLAFGGFGGGFGRNGELSQYATAASQNEILLGQKFDALSRQVNQVGDGLASSTYALNNGIVSEGRAIQNQLANCCCENQRNVDALRYDMAQGFAAANATTTAQTQKILDAMATDRIAALQAEVSDLKTQNLFCGVPRISPYMYNVTPSCGCGNI